MSWLQRGQWIERPEKIQLGRLQQQFGGEAWPVGSVNVFRSWGLCLVFD